MAISKLSVSLISIYFLIIFSNSASSSASYDHNNICNLTPYPKFCESNYPSNGHRQDIHRYGRYFIDTSLSSSKKFLSLLSKYLKKTHSNSSDSTMQAFEDCYLIADLNKDFCYKTQRSMNSTDSLSGMKAENLNTLLSATITNFETCLESLQQVTPSPNNEYLMSYLSNGTKYYSISLAFFKEGWASKHKDRKLGEMNSHAWAQRLYESVSNRGRKLLQLAPDNDVLVRERVVVNPDGSGNFTTINDAVAAAPKNTGRSKGYFVIHVVAGVYEEYVSIPKNKQNLMMIGDGINKTIITGNRSVVGGFTTFKSATFAVVGQGFVAVNMTFRNTAGPSNHQAVALRNGADLSAFFHCSFEGYQDTLYTHSMRQFYKNCDIYGTVDFIFGNAAVVFQDCNIHPRLPMQNQFNAITAQGRIDINQNTGISIHNCTITAASDLAASNGTIKTFLGRPWKQFSRTVLHG